MNFLPNVIFAITLILGISFFARNISKLKRNIALGKDVDVSGNTKIRWKNMARIALGQSKMVRRPIAGILHVIVYLGFVIINIEVLEIIIDGLFGTHRILSGIGSLYGVLIGTFEILAALVFVAVIIFWFRRNVVRIRRFMSSEMKGWPKQDGNLILYFEIVLMGLFIIMNATDAEFQSMNSGNIISQFLAPLFEGYNVHLIERAAWWMHIIGILIFLNYLYYSKHLHILLAFPNTYYGSVKPKGQFNNLEAVTNEVKLMMDPSIDPFAASDDEGSTPDKFGASDVQDLNWIQLLNAYTCTECGRCTSECPNEELWACTSCNACVEACPISIDPLSIILEMRRYLVMEQSAAPMELNAMMSNIENNGAPWPYNQMDRLNWKNE
jgi:ferredoxin